MSTKQEQQRAAEPIRLRLARKLREDEKFTKWMKKIDKDANDNIDAKEFSKLLQKAKDNDSKYESTWDSLTDELEIILFKAALQCGEEEPTSKELSYVTLRTWLFQQNDALTAETLRVRLARKLRDDAKFTKWMKKIDKDANENIDAEEFSKLLQKAKDNDSKYESTWALLTAELETILFNVALECGEETEVTAQELSYATLRKWLFPVVAVTVTAAPSSARNNTVVVPVVSIASEEMKQAVQPPIKRAKRNVVLRHVVDEDILRAKNGECEKCHSEENLQVICVPPLEEVADLFVESKSYKSIDNFNRNVWQGMSLLLLVLYFVHVHETPTDLLFLSVGLLL
jgi:Ca2+-binding EF-hand superfamily protein